jgi:hypothetical protein
VNKLYLYRAADDLELNPVSLLQARGLDNLLRQVDSILLPNPTDWLWQLLSQV